MSSLGYQSLYREVNELDDIAADRAMLPEDAKQALESGEGLLTLETGAQVGNYPLLAFSVAYELEIAGLIDCLRLSKIPILRQDRDDSDPILIGGGPLTFSNPVPLAPFFDVIIVGEGETLFTDLVQVCLSLDHKRDKICEYFSGKPGYYVPRFDGDICPPVAMADICTLPARSQIITPNTELRSMYLTEVARGCSRGCTYCVMRRSTNGGMRAIDKSLILEHIPEHAKRVGLVGAAVTDHPQITEIVRHLVDRNLEIGISSLRADKLTDEFVGLLARGGYRTLTVALDAPSQRMRSEIERVTQERHILRCAEMVRAHGLHTLKIYMIIGLPGEEDEDIDELIEFAMRIHKVHGRVALGIAPFVAKRHTPLDGENFAGIRVVEKRLKRLRKGLKGQVIVRPTSARWAWVEYMLAQGTSEAGLALMDAHLAGGTFADYKRAFRDRGCEPTGPLARVLSSKEIRVKKQAQVHKRLAILNDLGQ
ncbi:MAG: radical SAM protein [Kofleriaceae bacterium]|nr:radical SAM protein [Kofleriaceae bacterium]